MRTHSCISIPIQGTDSCTSTLTIFRGSLTASSTNLLKGPAGFEAPGSPGGSPPAGQLFSLTGSLSANCSVPSCSRSRGIAPSFFFFSTCMYVHANWPSVLRRPRKGVRSCYICRKQNEGI